MTVIKNPSKLLTKAKCFYLFPSGALHACFCTTREAEPTNWWARRSLYRMCSSDYVGDSFLLKRIYSKGTVIRLCVNGRRLCRPEQMNTCGDRCERRLYAAHARRARVCVWWVCSKKCSSCNEPYNWICFLWMPRNYIKIQSPRREPAVRKGTCSGKKKGDDN